MPLLPSVESTYLTSIAHLLRALALASRARAVGPETRGALLTELDAIIDWLAARAADAPFNFRHLLRLVEAERAWAVGDFRAAATAFDAALQECAGPATPLAPGADLRTRGAVLACPRHRTRGLHARSPSRDEAYLAWGATAKVDQLDWAYPTLKTADRRQRRPGGGADHPPIQHQDRDHRPARHPLRLPGHQLRDQCRRSTHPSRRRPVRDDRRERRPPPARGMTNVAGCCPHLRPMVAPSRSTKPAGDIWFHSP